MRCLSSGSGTGGRVGRCDPGCRRGAARAHAAAPRASATTLRASVVRGKARSRAARGRPPGSGASVYGSSVICSSFEELSKNGEGAHGPPLHAKNPCAKSVAPTIDGLSGIGVGADALPSGSLWKLTAVRNPEPKTSTRNVTPIPSGSDPRLCASPMSPRPSELGGAFVAVSANSGFGTVGAEFAPIACAPEQPAVPAPYVARPAGEIVTIWIDEPPGFPARSVTAIVYVIVPVQYPGSSARQRLPPA